MVSGLKLDFLKMRKWKKKTLPTTESVIEYPIGGVVDTWHSYTPESRCWGNRTWKLIEKKKTQIIKKENNEFSFSVKGKVFL